MVIRTELVPCRLDSVGDLIRAIVALLPWDPRGRDVFDFLTTVSSHL